jgi:hypothetical protein
MPQITLPEELVPALAELITKSTIPFAYVGLYDEMLLPGYPAAQVRSGGTTKELHGTSTWLITLRANIYVMHANMNVDRRTRNQQDLELVTATTRVLEEDMSLGGRIIHGFVENQTPDVIPVGSDKDSGIVSTRLEWVGIVERRFK